MYQSKKEQSLTSSKHKNLGRIKSEGKQVFSMNLGRQQKTPDQHGYSVISEKKGNKVDVNKIQNKIGRCLEKHKSKIQKTKQLIKLEKYKVSSPSSKSNFNTLAKKTDHDCDSSLMELRKKDCYILQKGRTKPQPKSEKVTMRNSPSGKKIEGTDNQEKLQQCYKTKKLPDSWNSSLNKIQNFSESTSTNGSRASIKEPRLSDFEIGRKLGEGKYGQVYIAQHKSSGMWVALKKMQKSRIDFYAKKQMIEEIKIQYYINHPNIIKLYSFFEDDDSIYLVIELFISGQLYSFLEKKKKVEERLVKSIVKQICQGLKHLHLNNIIHRDIKLENILFQMGMVKICDFGWSIETEEFRETFCGTPLYLSPEILQQKGYDNKIDVWSVGILTYELLYGRVPFEIVSQLDFAKIVYEDVKFPKFTETSKNAKHFIELCLIKDPNQRPTTQELLAHPFLGDVDEYQGSQIF